LSFVYLSISRAASARMRSGAVLSCRSVSSTRTGASARDFLTSRTSPATPRQTQAQVSIRILCLSSFALPRFVVDRKGLLIPNHGCDESRRGSASERKGEATAPAMARERATTFFFARFPMPRIISKFLRFVFAHQNVLPATWGQPLARNKGTKKQGDSPLPLWCHSGDCPHDFLSAFRMFLI